AEVGGGTVRQHVANLDLVADIDQRTLVEVCVLVRACVLGQRIDVDTGVVFADLLFLDADHDTAGVDLVDLAAAASGNNDAGVASHGTFDAGTDDRSLRTQRGYG